MQIIMPNIMRILMVNIIHIYIYIYKYKFIIILVLNYTIIIEICYGNIFAYIKQLIINIK